MNTGFVSPAQFGPVSSFVRQTIVNKENDWTITPTITQMVFVSSDKCQTQDTEKKKINKMIITIMAVFLLFCNSGAHANRISRSRQDKEIAFPVAFVLFFPSRSKLSTENIKEICLN